MESKCSNPRAYVFDTITTVDLASGDWRTTVESLEANQMVAKFMAFQKRVKILKLTSPFRRGPRSKQRRDTEVKNQGKLLPAQ